MSIPGVSVIQASDMGVFQYMPWFQLGESVLFCPLKENKRAQKPIPVLVSVCSFQICLHVLAIVWNLFWFRSMPKCELGSPWKILVCMRYQERFSRVWSVNFYKSDVCFPFVCKPKENWTEFVYSRAWLAKPEFWVLDFPSRYILWRGGRCRVGVMIVCSKINIYYSVYPLAEL